MNLALKRYRMVFRLYRSRKAVRSVMLTLLVLLAASSAPGASVTPQVLVDAELAFANRTAEAGIREGFLAFLADDSVVFRPGPVNGREAYAKIKPSAMLLAWYPVFADISAAGDLGYTTGPYEVFRNKDEKAALAFGHYVSLWRRQDDGNFKVVLDAGVTHGAHPSHQPLYKAPGAGTSPPGRGLVRSAAEAAIGALEKQLSETAAEHGLAAVLESRLSGSVRAYREGEYPALGRKDALELILKTGGRWSWVPARVLVSDSGDLGYAYGVAERKTGSPKKFAFLRIWRQPPSGAWKVVLDLMTAIPD